MSPQRNPAWTRDELILALDAYFSIRPRTPSPTLPQLRDLSRELNRIAEHSGVARSESYRSPESVVMKMMNFRSFDDEYPGEGLRAAGHADRQVWDDFATDRNRLGIIAQAIRAAYRAPVPEIAWIQNEIEEAVEGEALTRAHLTREREPRLVHAKKGKVLRDTGRLECEVCGFDFCSIYGERGRGYIECHHVQPLSTLRPGTKTRLIDLALVCANCHRMLHRSRPWPTIAELRAELVRLGQKPQSVGFEDPAGCNQ
jgi:5-methylcytosine-specific restriction protein A